MILIDWLRYGLSKDTDQPGASSLAALLAVAVGFGLLCYADITLTRDTSRIAVVWIPNALLAALLLQGKGPRYTAYLPVAFVGNVVANMLVGDGLAQALGLSLANSVEIGFIWWAMRRAGMPQPDMSNLRNLVALAAIGGICAPAVGGAVAAATLRPESLLEALILWSKWSLTDGLGILIVTPCALVIADACRNWAWPPRKRLAEAAALLVLATGATIYIFWQTRFPFLFLAGPILLLFAFRFGSVGAAFAVLEIALISSVGTALDHGPIYLVKGDFATHALVLQVFLACNFFMGLPVSAVLAGKKRVEDELKQTRDLGQSMLENMREIIFRTDNRGRWEFLNPAWEEVTGYCVQDSLGWPTTKLLHPDDLAEAARTYPNILSGEVDQIFLQQRFFRADGACRNIELSLRALRGANDEFIGTIGNIRDVTEARANQLALAASEVELRLLAKNATDAVFRLTLDGYCIYSSPSAQNLLGIPSEQLIGVQLLARFHAEDDETVRREFAKLVAGTIEDLVVAYRSERIDDPGHYVWLEAHGGLIRDAAGAPAEIIVSVRDVSANKALEEQLILARERAEHATAAKAAFLANMSHEIRTPMNGVLGFTELLQRSVLDPEQRSHLDMIAESGRSMMQLLNNILDMSKIDAGQMALANDAVDVRHTLKRAASLMQASAKGKGLELTIEIGPSVPPHLVGDELRIRQIMLNLIGNAIKFTERGTIAVHAREDGDDSDRQLVVSVADSGVGIAADRLEMVFEQFAQADSSIARKYGGTGLGLSISNDLARLMGGTIYVESVVGQGTTFTLRLPLVETTGVQGPDSEFAKVEPQFQTAPCRVLIAEDHDINQQLIMALARAAGLHPEIAADGSQAIDMVLAASDAGNPYDMVLMDVQMPVTDGLAATRQLRALGFGPDTLPIVALTANAYAEDIEACLSAGMQTHLSKPIRLRDLQQAVTDYVRNDHNKDAEPVLVEQDVSKGVTESLGERYRARRQQTLEAVSLAVRRGELDGQTIEELVSMLHKLAGTAGFFGDSALGDAASAMEHGLRASEPENLARVLADGWLSLQKAA